MAGAPEDEPSQELARAINNLAALLAQKPERVSEAKDFYERAIALHDALTVKAPGNREYKLEMAKFSNNYAEVLRELAQLAAAQTSNDRALVVLDDLVRPAPSLGIELADAHNLRGRILQMQQDPKAWTAYRRSLDIYQDLEREGWRRSCRPTTSGSAIFSRNLASAQEGRTDADARRLLSNAVAFYRELGHAIGGSRRRRRGARGLGEPGSD